MQGYGRKRDPYVRCLHGWSVAQANQECDQRVHVTPGHAHNKPRMGRSPDGITFYSRHPPSHPL